MGNEVLLPLASALFGALVGSYLSWMLARRSARKNARLDLLIRTCHHLEKVRSIYPVYRRECATVGEDGRTSLPREETTISRRHQIACEFDDARAALFVDRILGDHLLRPKKAEVFRNAVGMVYEAARPDGPERISDVSTLGNDAIERIAKLI